MRQLVNWFRRKQMDRDLDRELQYHLDRRITDFKEFGIAGPGSSQASNAGVEWHRENARGSARHLAPLVVDRFHIRLPLLGALLSQDALIYHYRRALAHAGHWS